ncbi:DoxX family protein [Methylobacterium sp. 77]|uniref:DoxX family protein n=1 Tax=Methylobacterium sp. 77 TaxID=1101192 RepID=UPI0003A20CD2|nr:DoxX family protein [Methylobacterium sp. 77]
MTVLTGALRGRLLSRLGLVALYGIVGIVHLVAADKFLPIMPDWVPWPRQVVILTGCYELACVAGLLFERTRKVAGYALAAYAICVFPANIKHAVEGISVPGLPESWWYHGPRLALQPVIVWWALHATHIVDWPFGPRRGQGIEGTAPRP